MRGRRGMGSRYGTSWERGLRVVAVVGALALASGRVALGTEANDLETDDVGAASSSEPGPINPGGSPGGTCVKCHTWDATMSHPIGVAISAERAKGLPLVGGKVTCLTCHDPEKADGHQGQKARGRTFLRAEGESKTLCVRCHASASTARVREHGMALGRAHIQGKAAGAAAAVGSGRLDAESTTCTSCHDGTSAPDAGSHQSRWGSDDVATDHPVGVKVQSRPRSRTSEEMRFVEVSSIDKRVRLYDRAVGCGSCHSLYSRQDKLLVMSNTGSQLCLKCHVQ